jgi:hypothetical protein
VSGFAPDPSFRRMHRRNHGPFLSENARIWLNAIVGVLLLVAFVAVVLYLPVFLPNGFR